MKFYKALKDLLFFKNKHRDCNRNTTGIYKKYSIFKDSGTEDEK